MSSSAKLFGPGIYRFVVKSAKHAIPLIHEKLGADARILSVRSVASTGLGKFLGTPRVEFIAQLDNLVPSSTAERFSEALKRSHCFSKKHQRVADSDIDAGLSEILSDSGISETELSRLGATGTWRGLNRVPLRRPLAKASPVIRAEADARPMGAGLSRAAFIGSSGVGRTTALCKWLSAEVLRRSRMGRLVTVEFDRPNRSGPLALFSEALALPVAHFPCATQVATAGEFVYFDLPALSVRRPAENAPITDWLEREQITERVLVLNAAYDRASLREAYAAGRDLGATHLVFTHLDEVPDWGKLWDYLFDETLTPLFLATGPSLTGECEEDVAGAIARRMPAAS